MTEAGRRGKTKEKKPMIMNKNGIGGKKEKEIIGKMKKEIVEVRK